MPVTKDGSFFYVDFPENKIVGFDENATAGRRTTHIKLYSFNKIGFSEETLPFYKDTNSDWFYRKTTLYSIGWRLYGLETLWAGYSIILWTGDYVYGLEFL